MMTLGHYMPHAFGAASAFQVAYDAAGQPPVLYWPASVPWAAAMGALAADYMQHREHLCERCAALAPLDPQKAVTRWKGLLRVAHVGALWIAWLLAASLLWTEPYIGGPHALRYALDGTVTCLIAFFVAALWKHGHLQPWCPWCNWGRGGRHEEVPGPDPAAAL